MGAAVYLQLPLSSLEVTIFSRKCAAAPARLKCRFFSAAHHLLLETGHYLPPRRRESKIFFLFGVVTGVGSHDIEGSNWSETGDYPGYA